MLAIAFRNVLRAIIYSTNVEFIMNVLQNVCEKTLFLYSLSLSSSVVFFSRRRVSHLFCPSIKLWRQAAPFDSTKRAAQIRMINTDYLLCKQNCTCIETYCIFYIVFSRFPTCERNDCVICLPRFPSSTTTVIGRGRERERETVRE